MSIEFTIDFEEEDLSDFDSLYNEGDLEANAAAAMVGAFGMEVTVNDADGHYGLKSFSPGATDIRFRFYLDLTPLSMPDTDYIRFVRILTDSTYNGIGVFGLFYVEKDGANLEFVMGWVDDDNTTHWSAAGATYTASEHYIEIHVHRETTDGDADGYAQIWIDGVSKETVTGIDNWNVFPTIDEAMFGSHGQKVSTTGSFYLDDLVMRNDATEIGPAGGEPGGITVDTGNISIMTPAVNKASPTTFSHTCGANVKLLVVSITIFDTSATDGVVSAVTYNGTPMASATLYYDALCDGHVSIWWLAEPDTGSSYTVEMTHGGAVSDIGAAAVGVEGTLGTFALDAAGTPQTGTTGDLVISWDAVAEDSISFAAALDDQTDAAKVTPQETEIYTTDVGDVISTEYAIRSSSGSQTMTIADADGDEDWVIVGAGFYEVAAGHDDLVAAFGSFSLGGQTTDLLAKRTMPASQGSFALSGQVVDYLRGFYLGAGQGSFALSGQVTDFVRWFALAAGPGSFALSGQVVDYLRGLVMPAGQGSFVLNGQDVGFAFGKGMTAEFGTFGLSGQATGLLAGRAIGAGQGSFALSGQDIGFVFDKVLEAGQGSFVLSGQDIGFVFDKVLEAGQGSFALSGQAVILDYSGSGDKTLIASFGSFTLTGQAADLLAAFSLPASYGTFVLTGQAAELLKGFALAAGAGNISLLGQNSGLLKGWGLAAGQGSFTLSGQDANIIYAILKLLIQNDVYITRQQIRDAIIVQEQVREAFITQRQERDATI